MFFLNKILTANKYYHKFIIFLFSVDYGGRSLLMRTILSIIVWHICVVIILFASAQINSDPDGYTLEHVMIVHRHALRAPTSLSNWSNADDYPMGSVHYM